MGEKTGKGFASAMFGAMKEGFDSRTTLEQLSSGSIANPASWIENKFIPDLKKDFGDYNSQFKMGTDESLAATKEWIDQLISIHDKYAEYLPTWFNQIIELKKKGDNELTDKEFMDVLDGVLNTTTEKVKDATKTQSVGYDNLKSTISDCADCAVSEFGQWQEAQTNLFAGSYIGQGGEAYKTYKDDSIANIRETQQAMKGYGVSVGKDYTGPEYAALDKNNTKLTADDTDLKAKLNSAKTLLDNIQTVADPVKVGANTDPFSQALQTMYNSIKPITIDVYYNELNSPGGTGGSNGFIPETTSGWDTFPSYDSGTDYVPYDQLAKIHKGEAVLTAEQNQNRGSGGNTVNIGPTIIEGDVNGVDDFEERMDRRDAELLKKMNAALKSMAKAQ